jgi:hypothetical protein
MKEFHGNKSFSTFIERTFRKAPQKPPSSVSVHGVDPSTVRVVWRYVAPSFEEEPLIGYKVNVCIFFNLKYENITIFKWSSMSLPV